MTMMRDEFDTWLKDPVTRWVFAAIRNAQEQERAEWMRQSWENGTADQHNLTVLKTRADALGELTNNDFETWSHWNGEEVEND